MCNGCKLIKIQLTKKQKLKGKKKYFVLDEDLMGFRYKPSKKPKGYKGWLLCFPLFCIEYHKTPLLTCSFDKFLLLVVIETSNEGNPRTKN